MRLWQTYILSTVTQHWVLITQCRGSNEDLTITISNLLSISEGQHHIAEKFLNYHSKLYIDDK